MSCIALNCTEEENAVFIRIDNASQHDFSNLALLDKELGNLVAGAQTDYSEFEIAYRYGRVKLNIDSIYLGISPIDFVGETPLENGKYTYKLDIFEDADGAPSNISLEFIED